MRSVSSNRNRFFREQRLSLQAADFAFHARAVAAIAGTGEIGSGDNAECSHLGQRLQLRIAKEIGAVANVLRTRRIERLRHSPGSFRTIEGWERFGTSRPLLDA